MGDSAGWGRKVVLGYSSDAMQGAAGRRLHPSAVTAVRSCREAAGARARSSLDLGPVVPGALRADWPTGPEDVGRVRRADHGADFGGRFRRSGPFQYFSPGWVGRALPNPAALQARCPFGTTPQTGGAGGGAELWRELVGRRVCGLGPRRDRCLFPGCRACLGTCGVGWGLRAAQEAWGAGPEGRVGGAGSDPLLPARRRRAAGPSAASAVISLTGRLSRTWLLQIWDKTLRVRCGVPS